MKKITLKFHKTIKYTDPSGMFKCEVELGLVNNDLMGKMVCSSEGFPTVTVVMGPFDPKGISELVDELKRDESEGHISNLVLGDEITIEGVELTITSEQIMMN